MRQPTRHGIEKLLARVASGTTTMRDADILRAILLGASGWPTENFSSAAVAADHTDAVACERH